PSEEGVAATNETSCRTSGLFGATPLQRQNTATSFVANCRALQSWRLLFNLALLQVNDGLSGNMPRVSTVRLPHQRVHPLAQQQQGRVLAERIEENGFGDRHNSHIVVPNRRPAPEPALAVEPFRESCFIQHVGGDGDMLLPTESVHEPEVNSTYPLVPDH